MRSHTPALLDPPYVVGESFSALGSTVAADQL
jgi:hypothetical protein